MHQQDSKSLAAENQEAETDEGTQFEKSLLELKELCCHLRGAANYCETSFLNAKEKRAVVENTKEYISRAVVTVVDHLGSVSANLECRLSKTNSVSEAELRIDSLKQANIFTSSMSFDEQRLGTCEKYSHLLGLRYHCWNPDFPRHHCRYILPPSPDLQRTSTLSRQIAAKTAEFQTGEVPLFLFTSNCKPSLVENSTSDEKRQSSSNPVLPVRDVVPVKYQHPNFHFQESPKLKRSMLRWKLAQSKDLRSVLTRRGKRTLT